MTTGIPSVLQRAIACSGSGNHVQIFDLAEIIGIDDDNAIAIEKKSRPFCEIEPEPISHHNPASINDIGGRFQ